MIVHLTGSLRDVDTDAEFLRCTIAMIHDHGAVLALSWLEAAIAHHENTQEHQDWSNYVKQNLEAIKRADVVIIDATHHSFSQGFQLMSALNYKKPTLIVTRDTLATKKYIGGLTNPLLSLEIYKDQSDLKRVVKTFLTRNTVYTKDLRFNMFLTRDIVKYLEERTQETGRSRSEIIRTLIKNQAEERHS
jgi:hypothetical protein